MKQPIERPKNAKPVDNMLGARYLPKRHTVKPPALRISIYSRLLKTNQIKHHLRLERFCEKIF